MHIYLVRHTEYSNPDKVFAFKLPFHLSEKGRIEALKIGSWFKEKNLMSLPIFSSPIIRTFETSEIIAKQTNSSVYKDSRLTETYCGELQGAKIPEKNSWIVEEDNPSRESHSSILKRVVDVYTEKINNGIDCIFVSHGDPLTLLYYYLINKIPPRYFWDPQNSSMVIQRGEIIDIEIINQKVISIKKINTGIVLPSKIG